MMNAEFRRYQDLLNEVAQREYTFPAERFKGRGNVICGGGVKYFPCAWVNINMLRRSGCTLPVQLWHLGEKEMTDEMRELLRPLGVVCVDGLEIRKQHPARILNGWELKPYAILHSPFAEVIALDADNVPVVNPEFLFETDEFRRTGAIFWPDYGRLAKDRSIWEICGIPYRDEPEFESGQIVVDKARCWKALQVTMHINEHSDFYYRHIHGDKETFHMGFHKAGKEYAMPRKGIHTLDSTMCQHDFSGRRIFQHRNLAKWNLHAPNKRISGFHFEKECLDYLEALRGIWKELPAGIRRYREDGKSSVARVVADELTRGMFNYHRVGHDQRAMSFNRDGTVGTGRAGCEVFWDVAEGGGGIELVICSQDAVTCKLTRDADGIWKGRWLRFEQMPVHLYASG